MVNTSIIKATEKRYENLSLEMTNIPMKQMETDWDKMSEFETFLKNQKGLTIGRRVGKGNFGQVYRVKGNESRVIKLISYRNYLYQHNAFSEKDDYINKDVYEKHMQKFLNEAYVHKKMTGVEGFPETYDVFLVEMTHKQQIVDVVLCIEMKKYDDVQYDKMSENDMLYLAKCILSCLKEAHKLELVNRDIRDRNVLFDSQTGKYILIDWGATKIFNQASSTTAAFTEGYVAPERAKQYIYGKTEKLSADRDPRSDLYSVGALLYYWANKCKMVPLTAYSGDNGAINVLSPQYGNIKKVPELYLFIMKRALNKDPEKRFQSAEEMLFKLTDKTNHIKKDKPVKKKKKRPVLIFLLLVICCLVIAGNLGENGFDIGEYISKFNSSDVENKVGIEKIRDTISDNIVWEQFIKRSYGNSNDEETISSADAQNKLSVGSTLPNEIIHGKTKEIKFSLKTSSIPKEISVIGLNDRNILSLYDITYKDVVNGEISFNYTLDAEKDAVAELGKYRLRLCVKYEDNLSENDSEKKYERYYLDTYINVVEDTTHQVGNRNDANTSPTTNNDRTNVLPNNVNNNVTPKPDNNHNVYNNEINVSNNNGSSNTENIPDNKPVIVDEAKCDVCGSKYHTVHPQNQAPDIPMNFD